MMTQAETAPALTPDEVLFPGEKPFPVLPAVDHYCGSEKLMKKAMAIQAELAASVVECLVATGTSVEYDQPLYPVKFS